MATGAGITDPLSSLIRAPLEKISKDISDMSDCAYKIQELERLAIVFPAYETIVAKIKRANDFEQLLNYIAKIELEINSTYQILANKLDEKQALYDKLNDEYEEFTKHLLASSSQINQLDKEYIEREYLEKLKELLGQLDNVIKLLTNKIQIIDAKIKEVSTEIHDLDTKIKEDTQNLIAMIDDLCETNNNKPDIEILVINIPAINEEREAIVNADGEQESVPLEFSLDKNLDKQVLRDLLQAAITSGQINKDNFTTLLQARITDNATTQFQPHLIELKWTKKEISDFVLQHPGINKFINHAKNTYDEKAPSFSAIFENTKELKENIEKRNCKIKEVELYKKEKEIYSLDVEKLKTDRASINNVIEYLNDPKNLTDTMQKSMQSASETTLANITKDITKENTATKNTQASANDAKLTTEEKTPPKPKTIKRSII